MKTPRIKVQPKQNGAALLVAMVLIFLLTILGLSAMRDSTLETQLAANAVHKEVSFQSAESATDIVLSIEDPKNDMAVETVICAPAVEFDIKELSKPDVQTTKVGLEYAGQSLPSGWSLGGPIGGRRFVVTGESTLSNAATSTRITQGVVVIGAVQQGVEC